jgi:saccharopine dehydrogenase-like NADP-dependent oxidoreductase
MRTLLLGAGHIGRTIAHLLAGSGDYRLTVADRDPAALAALAALAAQSSAAPTALATRVLDGSDDAALLRALDGHELVINALPYDRATAVARAARLAGCHYFDLTEDVAATRAIRELADGAPTAFMPQCGLAPGFVGIVAHHLAQGFDELHDLKMRVGALPVFPTNALKYNLTWSVDGLINEYVHGCDAIREGQTIEALPLEGLEHFSLDGIEYEAFNTSGGLGTLADTLHGRVRNLDYKSVRYPGHRSLMKVLLDELRLRDDTATLKAILRRSVPSTMQDVVLVFVTASGRKRGSLVQETFARKVFADRSGAEPRSAIQITTAAGVCAAVDLFRAGRLPERGFIRQEQIGLGDFMANRFGAAFASSRPVESVG